MKPRGPHCRSAGFSLIELMVGLVLGMFVVLIMMQLLLSTSKLQRTTSTSGNAQIGAAMATHLLTREITEAGLGISAYTLLGCSFAYTTSADGVGVVLTAVAPVTINPPPKVVPSGDANTDTLLVFSGSQAGSSEGDAVSAVTTASTYTVSTPSSFGVGDRVVAAATTRDSAMSCALTLGNVTAVTGYALTVSAGTAGLPIGSAVYNLGSAPSIRAYAVRNGNLTVCDYMVYNCANTGYASATDGVVWTPVVSNLVSLRLQYARDNTAAAMTGVVGRYDQITPGTLSDTSGLAKYCAWYRVVGMRMAVVARSQQYDKDKPTTAAPTWAGSAVNTGALNPTALPIDLSGNTEWQYYRYRTIESTIPLRNMIWNGNQVLYQSGTVAC